MYTIQTDNGARGWWNDIDPTVLIDGDDAWLCWGNGTCFLAKLTPDMTAIDGEIRVLDLPRYVEGPWLHKKGDMYYLTYASMGQGREAIAYATAPSMDGPWTPRGELTGMAENSFTIHPGIIEFNDGWYLFYHNATLELDGHPGAIGRRSVCVDTLMYDADGLMLPVVQTR
ncbi:MAG: family 43 glycosylhydrolase [Muribaculaceae bacterium]|nr:family 43 glycosylhydrolase [Muribaculaceae bacterium]